jgi:hypothetical protein
MTRIRADRNAEATRQTDGELEQALLARQEAERELAELKAQIEAQRQAVSTGEDQRATATHRATEEPAQRQEVSEFLCSGFFSAPASTH